MHSLVKSQLPESRQTARQETRGEQSPEEDAEPTEFWIAIFRGRVKPMTFTSLSLHGLEHRGSIASFPFSDWQEQTRSCPQALHRVLGGREGGRGLSGVNVQCPVGSDIARVANSRDR